VHALLELVGMHACTPGLVPKKEEASQRRGEMNFNLMTDLGM